MLDIADPVAAALKHLDLVVQSLDKATGMPIMKIIGDVLQVLNQGGQEGIKTPESTFLDLSYPTLDLSLGSTLDDVLLKNLRELMA